MQCAGQTGPFSGIVRDFTIESFRCSREERDGRRKEEHGRSGKGAVRASGARVRARGIPRDPDYRGEPQGTEDQGALRAGAPPDHRPDPGDGLQLADVQGRAHALNRRLRGNRRHVLRGGLKGRRACPHDREEPRERENDQGGGREACPREGGGRCGGRARVPQAEAPGTL